MYNCKYKGALNKQVHSHGCSFPVATEYLVKEVSSYDTCRSAATQPPACKSYSPQQLQKNSKPLMSVTTGHYGAWVR